MLKPASDMDPSSGSVGSSPQREIVSDRVASAKDSATEHDPVPAISLAIIRIARDGQILLYP